MGMTVTESGPASIFEDGTAFTIPLMDSGSIFHGYWGFVKGGIWEITKQLDLINNELGVKTLLSTNINKIDTFNKKIYYDNGEIDYDVLIFGTDPLTPSKLLDDKNGLKKLESKDLIGSSGKVTAFFKNPVRWKNV